MDKLFKDILGYVTIFYILKVFHERLGCFYVVTRQLFEHKDPPLKSVMACSFEAWSRGLRYFAVRNGSECLGDKYLPSMLPQLNSSKGCLGGRGGTNVSDVYRLTSKITFTLYNNYGKNNRFMSSFKAFHSGIIVSSEALELL